MKYEVFLPDLRLNDTVKRYIAVYDISIFNEMLFLPDGGNFMVFNRGLKGYSMLHNNKKYDLPESYSISIKTTKSKRAILDLQHIPIIEPAILILVELLPIGFYKLFHKDASCLNNQYLVIDNKITEKYFSNLYTHKSLEKDIAYLNESLVSMYDNNHNSKEGIEDIIEKIAEYKYEITVDELANEFACCTRTIERQFKKFIGISPKNFIFISKFYQTFMAYVKDGVKLNDTQYIYNDNAHLNKVFHTVVGYSPSQIFYDIKKNNNLNVYQLKMAEAEEAYA